MDHAETLYLPPPSSVPVRPPGEGSFLTLKDFDAKAYKAGLGLGGCSDFQCSFFHRLGKAWNSIPL